VTIWTSKAPDEVSGNLRNVYCRVVQNAGYCRKQQLQQSAAQMKWNQQALEAWLEEAARKDEDAMIVEKYSRVDDFNIKAIPYLLTCLLT